MTYGFAPENWPAFQTELRRRGIAADEIEKVEIRPEVSGAVGEGAIPHDLATEIPTGLVDVTVTLRSGRVEAWRQRQAEGA